MFATGKELKTKRGIVYCIINTINNKLYIGITKSTFYKRYGSKLDKYVSNSHLKKAIDKYGAKKFKIILLEINKQELELEFFEKFYINLFGTLNETLGYNKQPGGYSDSLRYNTEIFIKKATKIHGDKIDFSLVDYIHSQEKISCKCKKCGYIITKRPVDILDGFGCPKCSMKIKGLEGRLTQQEFLERAMEKHGDKFSYDRTVYEHSGKKVEIFCKICNIYFWQLPGHHLKGQGCKKCALNQHYNKAGFSFEEFQQKVYEKFGDKLIIYEETYKAKNKPVTFCCKDCLTEDIIDAYNILRRTYPCKNCKNKNNEMTVNTL